MSRARAIRRLARRFLALTQPRPTRWGLAEGLRRADAGELTPIERRDLAVRVLVYGGVSVADARARVIEREASLSWAGAAGPWRLGQPSGQP